MKLQMLIGVCVLVVLAQHSTAQGQQRDAPPKAASPPRLSNEDEVALRNAVYEGGAKSTIPRDGEWKDFEILIVPKEVKAIYAKDQRATIGILAKIVEGGAPRDAKLAAGYAISLTNSPVAGYRFTNRDDREYDKLGKDGLWTSREFAVKNVNRALEQLSKDYDSAPKKEPVRP